MKLTLWLLGLIGALPEKVQVQIIGLWGRIAPRSLHRVFLEGEKQLAEAEKGK
jgi:hypothetical protein